jgi:polyisoprenoid-binding protein YceI
MRTRFFIIIWLVFFTASLYAQGFKVNANGVQTFDFNDDEGRNQVSFFSETPLEDIEGISNDVNGSITFDVSDFKTLKGKLSVPVSSIRTGIEMRDGHLQSTGWLDAGSYPDITFEITEVSDVRSAADNKLTAKVTGNFQVHGVTKEVTADASVTYLDESEQTRKRAPGDLLGVQTKFNIKLSDYNISNKLIGQKVAENVEVTVNIVGSNGK